MTSESALTQQDVSAIKAKFMHTDQNDHIQVRLEKENIAEKTFAVANIARYILSFLSDSDTMSLLFLSKTVCMGVKAVEVGYQTELSTVPFPHDEKLLPYSQARIAAEKVERKVRELKAQIKLAHEQQEPLSLEAALYQFIQKVTKAENALPKTAIRTDFEKIMADHALNLFEAFRDKGMCCNKLFFYWLNKAKYTVPENKNLVLTTIYFALLGIPNYTDSETIEVNFEGALYRVSPKDYPKFLDASYLAAIIPNQLEYLEMFMTLAIACHFNSMLPVAMAGFDIPRISDRTSDNLYWLVYNCSLYGNSEAALFLLNQPVLLADSVMTQVDAEKHFIRIIIAFIENKMYQAAIKAFEISSVKIPSVYFSMLAYFMIYEPQLKVAGIVDDLRSILQQASYAVNGQLRPLYGSLLGNRNIFREVFAASARPFDYRLRNFALAAQDKTTFAALVSAPNSKFVLSTMTEEQARTVSPLAEQSLWFGALWNAAWFKDPDYFNILLENHYLFEVPSSDISILHIAAWLGLPHVIKRLLSDQSYLESEDYTSSKHPGLSALDCAIIQGHRPAVEAFLEFDFWNTSIHRLNDSYHPEPDLGGMHYSASSLELHRKLLTKLWDSTSMRDCLTQVYPETFNIFRIFSFMLAFGLTPSVERFIPSVLHEVLASTRNDEFRNLIQDWLRAVIRNPNIEFFQALDRSFHARNAQGFSALDLALLYGHKEIFIDLLGKGYRETRLTDHDCPRELLDSVIYNANIMQRLEDSGIVIPQENAAFNYERLLFTSLGDNPSAMSGVMKLLIDADRDLRLLPPMIQLLSISDFAEFLLVGGKSNNLRLVKIMMRECLNKLHELDSWLRQRRGKSLLAEWKISRPDVLKYLLDAGFVYDLSVEELNKRILSSSEYSDDFKTLVRERCLGSQEEAQEEVVTTSMRL